jgi:GNAT superfamily N-acetyltransferase
MTIDYRTNPTVTNDELDRLYLASWPNHQAPHDWKPELERLLVFVAAYDGQELIGSVKLAWDGDIHAFLLEPTVRPDHRRRGIGRALVGHAVAYARERGVVWVHVDFGPELRAFYQACGFQPTEAALMKLR